MPYVCFSLSLPYLCLVVEVTNDFFHIFSMFFWLSVLYLNMVVKLSFIPIKIWCIRLFYIFPMFFWFSVLYGNLVVEISFPIKFWCKCLVYTLYVFLTIPSLINSVYPNFFTLIKKNWFRRLLCIPYVCFCLSILYISLLVRYIFTPTQICSKRFYLLFAFLSITVFEYTSLAYDMSDMLLFPFLTLKMSFYNTSK